MRNLFLVAYDIRNDKRLRRIHRCLLGFGDALQYSVFACILSRAEKIQLLTAMESIIDSKQDTVMVADLGPHEGRTARSLEYLGQHPAPLTGRLPQII